jgi:steroid 5-alpha reductase family enzyme
MSFFEIYLLAELSILAFNTALWLVSLRVKNSSIIDPFWGILFLVAAIVYFVSAENGSPDHKVLLLALATIWSLRLSVYLAWRNWGKGEDFRYRKWRGVWRYTRHPNYFGDARLAPPICFHTNSTTSFPYFRTVVLSSIGRLDQGNQTEAVDVFANV